MYSSLSEKSELLDYYYSITIKLSNNKEDNERVLFILFQETLFGDTGISITDLAKESEVSEYKVRQIISNLKALNLIKEAKLGRKHLYIFDLENVKDL